MKIQDDVAFLSELLKCGLKIHGSGILRIPVDNYPGGKSIAQFTTGCQECGEKIDWRIEDKSYWRIRKSCGKAACMKSDLVTPVVKALRELIQYKHMEEEIYNKFPQIKDVYASKIQKDKERIRNLEKELSQCRRVEAELRQEAGKNPPKENIAQAFIRMIRGEQ